MKKLFLPLLSLTLGANILLGNDLSMSPEEKKEIAQSAKKSIKIIGGGLLKEVKKNMKEGGPTQAAAFCAHNATDVAKNLSSTLDEGITVRRITNKPRNPKNIPANEYEQSILNMMEETDRKKHPVVKKLSETHYQVYKPIRIKDKCLTCHGDNTTINNEAYKEIAKIYPNDKAIGYKKGEFRGAFLVDIVKK
jgi:hypothetical protein